MVDKRTLEFILTDQQEEMEGRAEEALCQRREESLIDIKSTQAQVVIGVRRSGKSTLCYQAMHNHSLKFAYADFDDERLVDLKADQLNDVLEILYKIYGSAASWPRTSLVAIRKYHFILSLSGSSAQ